jgi:uncharacterized protein (TIGR00251 family)
MPLILEVKVVPGSSHAKWVLDKVGRLKCYVKNPAEDHKANDELLKTLAKALGVNLSKVEIVAGVESRNKRIKIHGDVTFEQVLKALGLEQQQELFKKE